MLGSPVDNKGKRYFSTFVLKLNLPQRVNRQQVTSNEERLEMEIGKPVTMKGKNSHLLDDSHSPLSLRREISYVPAFTLLRKHSKDLNDLKYFNIPEPYNSYDHTQTLQYVSVIYRALSR